MPALWLVLCHWQTPPRASCRWVPSVDASPGGQVSASLQNLDRLGERELGGVQSPQSPFGWLFPCPGSSEKWSPVWLPNRTLSFKPVCGPQQLSTPKMLVKIVHVYMVFCALAGRLHAALSRGPRGPAVCRRRADSLCPVLQMHRVLPWEDELRLGSLLPLSLFSKAGEGAPARNPTVFELYAKGCQMLLEYYQFFKLI